MKSEKLMDYIGEIDDSIIAEADVSLIKHKSVKLHWIKWASAAACFVVIVALVISIPFFDKGGIDDNDYIKLNMSSGNLVVRYEDNIPSLPSVSNQLAYYTESELFHEFDTDIFSGTVKEVRNIEIDYNGWTDYRAIAKIEVNEVVRGNTSIGSTVTVLLPAPVGIEGLWVEDTEVTSRMAAGVTGIFMPLKYDETSCRQENGATLYLRDLADYGFLDGERYAFLETPEGLFFARWAYESIATATSLYEVKEFVEKAVDNEEVAQINIDSKIANVSDNYGGIYNDNGRTVVYVVDLANTDTTMLCKQLGINKSTAIFKEAKYSYKYLTDLQTKISDKMVDKTFSFITSSALLDAENLIKITVLPNALDEQIAAVKKLDTIGGAIQVEYSSEVIVLQ